MHQASIASIIFNPMNKKTRKLLPLILGVFSFLSASSSPWSPPVSSEEPQTIKPLSDRMRNRMTFGLEAGSSIDLSGYDTSTINADIFLTYHSGFIRNIGLGTGIHKAFGNHNTFIPVYFLFNSSFSNRPRLCFMHIKAGYSFNTIGNSPTYGDVCASLGLGFNLKMTRNMMSHIIIGYSFRHFDEKHRSLTNLEAKNIAMAQLAFGVCF